VFYSGRVQARAWRAIASRDWAANLFRFRSVAYSVSLSPKRTIPSAALPVGVTGVTGRETVTHLGRRPSAWPMPS
jgi:hypothetical protein